MHFSFHRINIYIKKNKQNKSFQWKKPWELNLYSNSTCLELTITCILLCRHTFKLICFDSAYNNSTVYRLLITYSWPFLSTRLVFPFIIFIYFFKIFPLNLVLYVIEKKKKYEITGRERRMMGKKKGMKFSEISSRDYLVFTRNFH